MDQHSSTNINQAIKALKNAILQSRYRAAKLANREMLSLYFGIGRFISDNSLNSFWGTGAIESISEMLQQELPGLRGFSPANIKRMRQFYESWSDYLINDNLDITNRPMLSDDLNLDKWRVSYR